MTLAVTPPASDRMKISAILPWFGSKRTMADRIARECCRVDGRPPKSFWDLACGSMAVSIAMPRCSHHHAVDLHADLINVARLIQHPESGPRFYRALRRVLNHETLFKEAKAAIEADDARLLKQTGLFGDADVPLRHLDSLHRGIAFFIVSWMGRNGVAGTERVNYQPAIRWTSGGGHGAIRFAGAVQAIPHWRRRLRDITIVDRDLFEVLSKIEDQDLTTIYIDPPYVRDGISRSGSCAYLHDFEPTHHRRLFTELSRFKAARIVVSYYDHAALRDWYRKWTFVECTTQKNLHVQNRRGAGRCEAHEVLIINGPSYTGGAS